MKLPCDTCHADCCGPVPLSVDRVRRIRKFVADMPKEERAILAAQKRNEITCAFVDTRSYRCAIYPVRPVQCEMYGRTAGMQCPHVDRLVNIVLPDTALLRIDLDMRSGWDILSNEFQWEDGMGGNAHEDEVVVAPQSDKQEVELLVCKCGDCTHWEIGRNTGGEFFILCKTCGLLLDTIKFEHRDHERLEWQKHER